MDAFVKRTKVGSARQQPVSHAGIKDAPKSPRRSAKRIKLAEIADSDNDNDDKDLGGLYGSRESSPTRRPQSCGRLPIDDPSGDVSLDTDMDDRSHRPTAIESSLPAIISDEEAIEQYESFKASQGEAGTDEPDSAASRLDSRKWIRGKSSLYVDAFNLALDTVLDEESHLFNARESAVFEKWRALPYESQFLYVRLFLRKNAQWHRTSKLGYHSDIQDVEGAVLDLQQARDLPVLDETETFGDKSSTAAYIDEETTLGEQFVFADTSAECITTVPEAVSLLSLDETKAFAKEAKVRGKNKGDIAKSICRTSRQQSGLFSVGLRRSSTMDSATSLDSPTPETGSPAPDGADDTNRNKHFLEKILAIVGPCIRLSLPVFKLFERVHLVFYRSTEWTDKSLTAIILAKISRRNFPVYVVSRSANIFASRAQLLEFETSMRTEFAIDNILEFNGPVREADFHRVIGIFEKIYPRWQTLLVEEQLKEDRLYESGEGAYLRRLNPGHSYTRIVHKAAHTFGRLKNHKREHELLSQLLEQRLFHLARRGAWYQRKALLEEHYMFALEEDPAITDVELQKKHWKRISVTTCEIALEDRDCHLIYHYDIQKRIVKLEKQLKVPKRLQHDFGHVRLKQPEQHHVHGIQLKKVDIMGKRGRGPSTKTIWVDEAEGGGECSVEALCLSDYRSQGWKGYHAEGGIVRTLFAYLFFDILFIYIPNVFQTAYQTCPLDLHTDAFYATRCSEVNYRLVEIANGQGAEIIRAIDKRERERRTCVVGLNWDYELEDLVELADCFNGAALATICKVMAQEYGQRGGGIPDLILWRSEPSKEVMFSEVKSANDRLSDTQRLWIHVLTGAGIRVALCNVVADEVREV